MDDKNMARLYAKIAAVTAGVSRIKKSGFNTHQNYPYAKEEDITDGLRELMGEQKLAIIPRVDSTERIPHPNERLEPITRLYMTFTIACGDTGATMEVSWIGDGQDTADKGLYKAYTGAEKYFLMKLFMVATGDDPEDDAPRQTQRPSPRGDSDRPPPSRPAPQRPPQRPVPQRPVPQEPTRQSPAEAAITPMEPSEDAMTPEQSAERAAARRKTAITKIHLMWGKERKLGLDLDQQQREQAIPIEDAKIVSMEEIMQLGLAIQARLTAAREQAEADVNKELFPD